MFDRVKFKDFSRRQLKGRTGVPVLMTLFTTVIMGLFTIPLYVSGFTAFFTNVDFNAAFYGNLDRYIESISEAYLAMGEAMNRAQYSPLNIVLSIVEQLLAYIFVVCTSKVYIMMSRSPAPVSFKNFIEAFELWGRAILTGLYETLFETLWTLCFIFPGIIKHYAYSQMFYLAVEFPNVSIPDLMNISKKITHGHKWDLFVLDLSFIGWFILGSLSYGIANLWIKPYFEMTKINAYHAILKEAVDSGIVTLEELKIQPEQKAEKEDAPCQIENKEDSAESEEKGDAE